MQFGTIYSLKVPVPDHLLSTPLYISISFLCFIFLLPSAMHMYSFPTMTYSTCPCLEIGDSHLTNYLHSLNLGLTFLILSFPIIIFLILQRNQNQNLVSECPTVCPLTEHIYKILVCSGYKKKKKKMNIFCKIKTHSLWSLHFSFLLNKLCVFKLKS